MADFRESGHLPNRRDPGDHADPYHDLPRQRRGTTPQMHGRYPDYDVLEQAEHWDEATRRVVLERVESLPEYRFFKDPEVATLEAFCDVVTGQDAEPRIEVLRHVDAKLRDGRLDGWQYADMPDDGETGRLVAQGLDDEARRRGADVFASAPHDVQRMICRSFAEGDLAGGVWDRLPVDRAWSVVMRMVLQAFYAHPWAWNEIGFGGPAYPRGYSRLGESVHEAWEGREAFERDPVPDVQERRLD
jgi:Gluconate 2-dehydrogenase subunit 3